MIIGRTLSNSSSTVSGSAPGRVDSPPISIISEPSSIKIFACLIAFLIEKNLPQSLNESGVMFRTPMISVLLLWLMHHSLKFSGVIFLTNSRLFF